MKFGVHMQKSRAKSARIQGPGRENQGRRVYFKQTKGFFKKTTARRGIG
jgi:hypothetical protein